VTAKRGLVPRGATPLDRALRRLQDRSRLLRRATEWRPLGRLLGTILVSRFVSATPRFLARELSGSRASACYTLRDSGLQVWLRHSTPDVQNFDEIFYQRLYEPPAAVEERLRGARLLDLGANIGLAGAYFLGTLGVESVVAFEPDPSNVELHRRTIEANGLGRRWRLVAACAATADGTATFAAGQFAESHVAPEGEAGAIDVDSIDVFPDLERAGAVKMDVEGAEWDLLLDPRFEDAAASALVLEYHAYLCPEPDPRALAERVLHGAGYETEGVFHESDGTGMIWAWRHG
jgi:FkbM family methyltransferase